jgi:hypothetical protein
MSVGTAADWVIQAQVGHVAPEMMKTYSHIRREALNQAAAALEPTAPSTPAPPREHRAKTAVPPKKTAAVAKTHVREKKAMSQSMSQLTDRGGRLLKFPRKNGSPVWTTFATGSSIMQPDRFDSLFGDTAQQHENCRMCGDIPVADAEQAHR